jgi:uncharacterized membrane protein YkoI
MARFHWMIASLTACLLLAPISATRAEDKAENKLTQVKDVLGKATVTLSAALETAQKKVPDGKPIIARVEMKKGVPLFGFYFQDGDKIQEVEVNALTGDVAKFEEYKEVSKKIFNAQRGLKGTKVSFAKALEIAAGKVKDGKAFEVEIEFVSKDKAVVEVEMLIEGQIKQVQIDAADPDSVTVKDLKKE